MNIIEIENLTYSYPAAKSPILKNISLTVEEGDFLAVVGNNGCGKSTFCKTLNGLIPHFIDGDFEGTVKVGGINTLESDVGTLACKAGYVYQDFENQIVRPTVLDDASYACLNYAMPDYIERGRQALSLCGLEGREDDYIWQLSGGQTHLLALAGAVSLRPHCVEASHGRGAAPGGGAAGMQYLPAPGDHCRSPDETGREAAGGTALAHHRSGRGKRFSAFTVSSLCLYETGRGRDR